MIWFLGTYLFKGGWGGFLGKLNNAGVFQPHSCGVCMGLPLRREGALRSEGPGSARAARVLTPSTMRKRHHCDCGEDGGNPELTGCFLCLFLEFNL